MAMYDSEYVSGDDECLDLLHIPPFISNTLPLESLPIHELLGWDMPPETNVVVEGNVEASQLFSSAEPYRDIGDILSAISVPPRQLVKDLEAAAGQAILQGYKSIRTPTNPQVNVPLWTPMYWTVRLDVLEAQKTWNAVMRWVNNTDDATMKRTIRDILAALPWHGRLKGFGIHVIDLAQLLSNAYLNDKIMDALIAVLTLRLRRTGASPLNENTLLLDSTFGSFLMMLHPIVDGVAKGTINESKGGRRYLDAKGKWLKNKPDGQVYTIVYRPEEHWTVCKIAARQQHIQYGDGMRWKRPEKFFESLGLWLQDYTEGQFRTTEDLRCAWQTDGFNCGIIATNTIAHDIFGDPLWTAESSRTLRMKAFCDIVDADQWMQNFSIDLSELDLADSAQNVLAAKFTIDEDLLEVALDGVHQAEAPAPATVTESLLLSDAEIEETPQPAETKSLKRRAEQPLDEQEDRRGKAAKTRTVTTVTPAIFLPQSKPFPASVNPKPKTKGQKTKPAVAIADSSSTVVGISLAATKARELRDQVKNGTFQASDTKTVNFRRKITTEWDPDAEFEETCKHVWCSTCQSWVAMKSSVNQGSAP